MMGRTVIRVKIKGAADFQKNAMAVLKSVEQQAEVGLDHTAESVLSDSKDGTPVATGKLKSSEAIEKERLKRRVGTNVDYALFVHDGTYKMPARRFLMNAVVKNYSKFVQEMKAVKV